jgi:glycosyltransferase involved in cell wall biosynthesis
MKCLIIHPRLVVGGAERVILLTANGLSRLGIDVDLAFNEISNADMSRYRRELISESNILRINSNETKNSNGLMSRILCYVNDFKGLASFLIKNSDNYDVIIPHNFPSYWSVALFGKTIPVIWTCHEVLGFYGDLRDFFESKMSLHILMNFLYGLDRFIVKNYISKIITNSKMNVRLLAGRYGVSSFLAYPPVDIDLFCEKRRKRMMDCDLVLLHVGRLVKLKNHIASLVALRMVKREVPNSKLIIIGDGSWKGRLLHTAKALGLQKDVILLETLNDYELAKIYGSSDICLHPVLEQSFGITPFEAVVSGTPAVVSNKCGAAEIFMEYAPEMLADPEPCKIANKILEIYHNYDEFMDRVSRFRNVVFSKLSPRNYCETILRIIKEVY